MEITVTGRHTSVSDRFRRHIEEKLAKIPQLDPRVVRAEVVVTHEQNPRQAKEAAKLEITCYARRTVIRAEASADEDYAALDVAMTRLGERLRRYQDKRRVHRGRHQPISVAQATAGLPTDELLAQTRAESSDSDAPQLPDYVAKVGGDEDCPVTLREKTHQAPPMLIDEALSNMELVGHDFFLFYDEETRMPSVVYRRKGWSYGVIRLEVGPAAADGTVDESEFRISEPSDVGSIAPSATGGGNGNADGGGSNNVSHDASDSPAAGGPAAVPGAAAARARPA